MSLDNVLSQDNVANSFRNAILKKHLSHAYIFTGQKGVGKSLFAKEFSKLIFCKNKENDSCDICNNCKRIESNNNPDIHWIGLGKKDKFVKIENIREIQHYVRISPLESESKIFIIKQADKMTEEAANCLLKTLEEPSPNTIIILIANSLTPIKDTIRSRCQIFKFSPIPVQVIKEHLINNFDADTRVIEWVSRFCCGSLGTAIDLMNDKFYEKNEYIINRISELNLKDNLNFVDEFIESYLNPIDTLEEKRHIMKSIFNCILQYYRDLLIFKIRKSHSINSRYIPIFNAGHDSVLQTQSNRLTQEQIMNIIDEILLAIKHIDYNLNINLLMENIITKITILMSCK